MEFTQYKKSLTEVKPQENLSDILKGLWYDANGNWDKAHDLIDGNPEHGSSWAHAYLHRKEGDLWNADYWYRRAGRIRPNISLDEEWEEIVRWLITDNR